MRLRAKRDTKISRKIEVDGVEEYRLRKGNIITIPLDDFEQVDDEWLELKERVKDKPNTPKECICKIGFTDPECPETKPKLEKLVLGGDTIEYSIDGVDQTQIDRAIITDQLRIVEKINQLVDAIKEINND